MRSARLSGWSLRDALGVVMVWLCAAGVTPAVAQVSVSPGGLNAGDAFFRFSAAQNAFGTSANNLGPQFLQVLNLPTGVPGKDYAFRQVGGLSFGENPFREIMLPDASQNGVTSDGSWSILTNKVGGDTGAAIAGYDYDVTLTRTGGKGISHWTLGQRFSFNADGTELKMIYTFTNVGSSRDRMNLYWVQNLDVTGGSDRLLVSEPGVFQIGADPGAGAFSPVLEVRASNYPNYIARGGVIFPYNRAAEEELFDTFNSTNAFNGQPGLGGVTITDVSYGYQWVPELSPGQSGYVSVSVRLIPGPGSGVILSVAGLTLARRRR